MLRYALLSPFSRASWRWVWTKVVISILVSCGLVLRSLLEDERGVEDVMWGTLVARTLGHK